MSDDQTIPCTWRGLPAIRLVGGEREAVLSLVGGHLASLRLRGDDGEPLWQPGWAARDPAALTVADLAALGGGDEAPLLSAITGSNLCCDRFGHPWPGETRPLHGEAGVTRFAPVAGAPGELALEAWLPQAALRERRGVRFAGADLALTTTITHLGGTPRAVEWCEHTSLGGPLLDEAEVAAELDAVFASPFGGAGTRHPQAVCGDPLPVAECLRMPQPGEPHCGDVLAGRIAPGPAEGTWSITNRRLGRRLGCRFQRADWPWLALWTQHRSRTGAPWNGAERVRGMELSTKPIPEGLPPPERREQWQGRPTTCLVPPGPGATRTIHLRWERC
jgi:hypothetical protein